MPVLPDVSGLDRVFDYALAPPMVAAAEPGCIVRVPLRGRRVRGWVLAAPRTPDEPRALREVIEVVSPGPPPAVLDLARFGAWRYAGRLRPFLVAASPRRLADAAVPAKPGRMADAPIGDGPDDELQRALAEAVRARSAVLRLAPGEPRLPVVLGMLELCRGRGDLLVLVPERREVEVLVRRLAKLGLPAAGYPEDWGAAAQGGRVVVGTRSGALAPLRRLGALLAFDAHSDTYVEERAPTWSGVVLARERALRADVPFVAVSPCPGLELLEQGELVTLRAVRERSRWPALEVLDRRGDDPRSGRYAPRLAPAIAHARAREPGLPVCCVLNRTGRARRLVCLACGELARCERCAAALVQTSAPGPGEAATLECPTCRSSRPVICASCGGRRMRLSGVGIQRAGEELAALTGLEVATLSGASSTWPAADVALVVGTEAVLHRVRRAALVVFLDFDLDLTAPRLRAGEHALGLLAMAGRLVGPRPQGRLLVQTRWPDHEALVAARAGDPGLLGASEAARRRALRLPPYAAVAKLAGQDAGRLAERLADAGVEVADLGEQERLVRCTTSAELADALAAAGSPDLDVRVEVDPLSL